MTHRILVTGGAGYIGSHTSKKLLDAGYEVFVLDNLSTGFEAAIPSGCQFIRGDVLDTPLLIGVLKEYQISAVVHFAAKLIVPESVTDPIKYYYNNTFGVMSLASACQEAGVKNVVFSSTAAVYGNIAAQGLITELAPIAPLNPYGYSKWMSEQILRDCDLAFGLKSICLRYFNVAGASEAGINGQRTKEATHLIKVASEAACGLRSEVKVFGNDYQTVDGTGVRDYIHVDDLADIHVLALKELLENKGLVSEVYNCGYGQGYSVLQVLEALKAVSGVDFKVTYAPRRAGDAGQLVADVSKLKKKLGWQPRLNDLNKICASAYNWEKVYGTMAANETNL